MWTQRRPFSADRTRKKDLMTAPPPQDPTATPPVLRPQPFGTVNPLVGAGVVLGAIVVALVAAALVSAPTSPPGTPTEIHRDGQYLVDKDLVPGTYRTAGVLQGRLTCYWERQKDTLGTDASILANAYGQGPATVTIPRTDAAFKTSGCQPWTKAG